MSTTSSSERLWLWHGVASNGEASAVQSGVRCTPMRRCWIGAEQAEIKSLLKEQGSMEWLESEHQPSFSSGPSSQAQDPCLLMGNVSSDSGAISMLQEVRETVRT